MHLLCSLACTLLGHQCPYFDLNPSKESIILIIARQHPIETLSSYLMEYFLDDLLLSDSLESKWLLANFHFIIVPMVNIDGVVAGSSRHDVAGFDPNRTWNAPRKNLNPVVYGLKRVVKQYVKEGQQVRMFFDLHCHSTKLNSFSYGCTPSTRPVSTRLFPLIFHSTSHIFNVKQCVFSMSKDRQNTARVVMFEEFKVRDSFTIETSYFGHDKSNTLKQFQFSDLKALSQQFLKAIFYYQEESSSVYKNAAKEIDDNYQTYLDLNKDEPDQSESDINIDEESIVPEEEPEEVQVVKEEKRETKKKVKKSEKKEKLEKKVKTVQTKREVEEKKVEKPEKKKVGIKSPPPQSRSPSPAKLRSKPQTTQLTRRYQTQSNSISRQNKNEKKLPSLEKNSMLRFVEKQITEGENRTNEEFMRRKEYYERTKTMYTPTKNSIYREKIRFRQRLNNIKLFAQLQYDSVENQEKDLEKQSLSLKIDRRTVNPLFRRQQRGNFQFSAVENQQRLHTKMEQLQFDQQKQQKSKSRKEKPLKLFLEPYVSRQSPPFIYLSAQEIEEFEQNSEDFQFVD